jgi:hypothetical protein
MRQLQLWISQPAGGLAIVLVALALAGLLIWKFLRRKPSPEELEKRRRTLLNASGKLGDAEVIDVEGAGIVYSYSVRGVGYTAAQDVTSLESLLPENTMTMIGPALVKFDPRNPANSIVLCEEWSGLGGRVRARTDQV